MPPDLALLVVDGEAADRAFVAATLGAHGWRVDAVESGERACARAHATAYAMILIDIALPDMDGFAAAEAIRASDGASAAAPILAYAAASTPDLRARQVAAGIDGLVSKPCTAEALAAEAERWRPSADDHPVRRIAALLGEDEIAGLLARFRERLVAALAASADPAAARALAHGLAGIAGTLGFADVHAAWLDHSEGDKSALAPAREASRKAINLIDHGLKRPGEC